MRDVLLMKDSVNRMPLEKIRGIVKELQLEGIVTEGKTPFTRVHFNTCFAEIEALLQRAGYHRQLDVVGYQGLAYAMFDPARWEAVEVLRWLKALVEEAQGKALAR
ncbi:transcriptional regulator [uncultured Pseudomonas sp.]|uniref:transcriptional regulator n=1 Tax=uncultured Pseudomonas sp. TaxID=114707 RepID=UPI00262D429C|nr:transcriptional regulator [uncultured Pseudomonas sp.]